MFNLPTHLSDPVLQQGKTKQKKGFVLFFFFLAIVTCSDRSFNKMRLCEFIFCCLGL